MFICWINYAFQILQCIQILEQLFWFVFSFHKLTCDKDANLELVHLFMQLQENAFIVYAHRHNIV